MHCISETSDQLGCKVVERPPRVRDVAGSIPGRVIPMTFKMEVMAALLCAEGLAWRMTGWCEDNGPVVMGPHSVNAVI